MANTHSVSCTTATLSNRCAENCRSSGATSNDASSTRPTTSSRQPRTRNEKRPRATGTRRTTCAANATNGRRRTRVQTQSRRRAYRDGTPRQHARVHARVRTQVHRFRAASASTASGGRKRTRAGWTRERGGGGRGCTGCAAPRLRGDGLGTCGYEHERGHLDSSMLHAEIPMGARSNYLGQHDGSSSWH